MTKSRNPEEPSMEEILSSIRKIIATDDREALRQDESKVDMTAAAPRASGAASERPPVESAAAALDEVLLLTEMIQEDGSVVRVEQDGAGDAASKSAGDIDAPTPVARAAPEPEPSSFSRIAASDPFGLDNSSDLQEVRGAVSDEIKSSGGLVSEQTLAASTAALAQLAQSVNRTRESPASTMTVEDLVRDAVQPAVKSWLDANLSRIVERMVREAINQMVRRVDD